MKDLANIVEVRAIALGMILTVGLGLAGCKAKPAVSDDALTTTIQSQLSGDSAIAGQQITVSVQGGVATLNGVVANDAQRTIAARDAAGVAGVKEVQNALVVGTASVAAATPAPAPEPLKPSAGVAAVEPKRERERHEAAPIERMAPPPPPVQQANQPAPPPVEQAPAPAPPPPPPQPVFKSVTIQAGDSLPVRVTQTLDSATTQQGTAFSGVVASDIVVDGVVAIPAGTVVSGQVDVVHEAAHFKGAALLTVSLNSLTRKGEKVPLTTDPYTVEGKGRGKNTLEKTGGGAAVGAILGGIFGGGKGAAIGAAAGGGVGAGANAVTRGQQVQIPSETVVRFKLSDPVTVRVRTDAGRHEENGDPNLQHHPGF
jgi:hypothetical protein